MNNSIKYKILVVDDSSVMRKGIIDLIQSEISADFTEAEDGDIALNLYKEIKPDLITLDINMPRMNGIEALKQILKLDSNAKVIMLTTEAEKSRIIEAISLGAKSYIVKPMDKDKSMEKIKNTLGI